MQPKILTALPVYNEAAHVAGVLESVRRYCREILVVNDGSRDDTAAELAKFPDVRVVHHASNLGYGAALRSAFDYATAHGFDVLVTIDCDGQHEPRLIPKLAGALTDEVDIVSGSRYLSQLSGDSIPPADRRHINFVITELLNQQLGLSLTDAFCGFKAYRVGTLKSFDITVPGYAMPLQLWVQAVAAGLRIVEFPVPLIYLDEKRSFGGSLDDAKIRLAHYRDVLDRELARSGFPALPRDHRGISCATM
jgi:glycosyltransferase involved in cell wall biosynthesis